MNYPKVLYKGEFYTDYQQLSSDVHSHKIAQVIVAGEEEEADVRADGFGDLGELMANQNAPKAEVKAVVVAPKRRGAPPGGWPKKDKGAAA